MASYVGGIQPMVISSRYKTRKSELIWEGGESDRNLFNPLKALCDK